MKNPLFSMFALFALTSMLARRSDATEKWRGAATGKGSPLTFNLK